MRCYSFCDVGEGLFGCSLLFAPLFRLVLDKVNEDEGKEEEVDDEENFSEELEGWGGGMGLHGVISKVSLQRF